MLLARDPEDGRHRVADLDAVVMGNPFLVQSARGGRNGCAASILSFSPPYTSACLKEP